MIPTLTTQRLVLRGFTPRDVPPLHAILNGENVLRYFPDSPPPSLERVEKMVSRIDQHWEQRGYGLWAVEILETGELAGRCGLQLIPETLETEIDFILGPAFWGKGFATEAGKESLRFGFDERQFDLIVGIVHPENAASRRVLEKLGMAGAEPREYFGIRCLRYVLNRSDFPKSSAA